MANQFASSMFGKQVSRFPPHGGWIPWSKVKITHLKRYLDQETFCSVLVVLPECRKFENRSLVHSSKIRIQDRWSSILSQQQFWWAFAHHRETSSSAQGYLSSRYEVKPAPFRLRPLGQVSTIDNHRFLQRHQRGWLPTRNQIVDNSVRYVNFLHSARQLPREIPKKGTSCPSSTPRAVRRYDQQQDLEQHDGSQLSHPKTFLCLKYFTHKMTSKDLLYSTHGFINFIIYTLNFRHIRHSCFLFKGLLDKEASFLCFTWIVRP